MRHALLTIPVVLALLPQDAPDQPERLDYLTFAQGAIPIRVGGAGASQGATLRHATQIIDGNPQGFTVVNRATPETDTEFIYELPAPTTFDRFAVPHVLETPSPFQTFTKLVEVHGSASGPDDGYVLLASGTLETHARAGQVTELTIVTKSPVRWVKLRLVDGIQMLRPQMFLEFGEIIGNGTQEPVPLSTRFTGTWRGRGVRLETTQDGPVVTGCYDTTGQLTGTVTGSILRATGVDTSDGVESTFILIAGESGTLQGVRSTNGAPFTIYNGDAAPPGTASSCPAPPPPTLGCGSVIHGIQFGFDSADLTPDSEPVLAALFKGLQDDSSAAILIEGHTSSEGAEAYNQSLSERRARAVADDLIRRGIGKGRLSSAGAGEARPIATNDDESGRSLNRRVEVHCR
jgi:outer membrane protein OmpA-like peptidoglycan-associated protein